MILRIRNEFVLILLLGLILGVLIAMDVQGVPAFLPIMRIVLGILFTLYIPGYLLQAALFPCANDLAGKERLALSFGLSVAVVPPMALILDQLPWGIRLWPIVIAEALVIVAFTAAAWFRRSRLPEQEKFQVVVEVRVKEWWLAQDRTSQTLYGSLFTAIFLAVLSALLLVFLPRPTEHFTEFYILGEEGLAERYPWEPRVGEVVSVTVGIANHEDIPAEYRIEVVSGNRLLSQVGSIWLEPDQVYEQPLSFAPASAGDDVEIEFFLYRGRLLETPYRTLRLWLTVVE